ncbi:MAG: transposase [SAR324 cluster bacterium]|nr:transposase [SAR324 cluster bacterium]
MFDLLDHLGPKRRKLLEQSWSFLFRREILSNLPVDQILPYYASDNGAPTKELYSMLGLMLLQQCFDLTDKEAIKQFAFNFEWHYALGIKDESDKSTYVSEKTLWNTRYLLTENDLYQSLFDIPTRQLADLCGVDPSRQRLDSVHIFSNMRHLGRIGLFVRTIKKFLQYLKRHHPGTSGFGRLEKSLRDRYLSKEESSVFSMVKPSETPKTLQNLAEDLFSIIRCYRDDPKVTSMKYYKLMLRLLDEQCIVGYEQDDG